VEIVLDDDDGWHDGHLRTPINRGTSIIALESVGWQIAMMPRAY